MEFDFTQAPPNVSTLTDCRNIIESLWIKCRDQQSQLIALQDKLNTNSTNSSLPPSSDSIRDKAKRAKKRSDSDKQSTLYWEKPRQGAQPGHKGTGRCHVALSEVDKVVICEPDLDCGCSGAKFEKPTLCQRKQVFELPSAGGLHITEYQIYKGRCSICRKAMRGALPEGLPTGILGETALAKIAVLTGKYRLSKREVTAFLKDFFGLDISIGTVSNAEKKVSEAIEAPVSALAEEVKQSDSIHCDETSHRNAGELRWLWVATNADFTYFSIELNRNKVSAMKLIGEDYPGVLISDRYAAYNFVPLERRQFCWAHLKRDFQKIADNLDCKQAYVGSCLLSNLESIFRYWRNIQAG